MKQYEVFDEAVASSNLGQPHICKFLKDARKSRLFTILFLGKGNCLKKSCKIEVFRYKQNRMEFLRVCIFGCLKLFR